MKLLQFIFIFFVLTSTSAQDSWTQHFGLSKEDIVNSFNGNEKYKNIPTGNYYQLLYRIYGGTENEVLLLFYFSNPDAKCTGVALALPIRRLQDMVKLLKSSYPNYNNEQTKFWSEREIAEINDQGKQFFISYTANE